MKKPSILSPIQDYTSLSAAIQNGADAVYFGIQGFNMRANAKNFTSKDLQKITKIAHQAGIKAYLALNTIIYEEELPRVKMLLKKAKAAQVDAVICWDLAVVQMSLALKLETHLSTQASVANSEAAKFYKKLGIKRIVLARECELSHIKDIKKHVKIEIETFVHGAMCVSESGRCFMSQFGTCKSANRGACVQPCRRNYLIKDIDGEFEFEVGQNYVLSPKDLCTLPFIEKLMDAGIDCFKIEGRNKSPEYVAETTRAYRTIVDFIYKNQKRRKTAEFQAELADMKTELMQKLERVYNRGFSNGFYFGKPMDAWTKTDGSEATERKIFLGKVMHFYDKIKIAELHIDTHEALEVGEEILIQGPTTGNYRTTVTSMEIEHKKITKAKQHDDIAFPVDERVRTNDLMYVIRKIK
jgi:putative protease